ncbi:MAG: alanine racemase [Anaerolineaceae bacterium]|nr:alanine racemase [Anaerolineaceae bacterium]
MTPKSHPNWIEINLSAIEHNVKYILESTKKPLMAVVKGDAYGFGTVEVAKTALAAGASWLGVARYHEARTLRDAGIQAPILVLGFTTLEEVDQAIANRVSLTLYAHEIAEMFSERAKMAGKSVLAHLKVDTGLGRLGVYPHEALGLAQHALELGGITLEGMFSHFAMSAEGGHPYTDTQIKRFKEAIEDLDEAGIRPRWLHMANSAGAYYEKDAHFNLVRSGSAMYGLNSRNNIPYPASMRRPLTWKARLASCKVVPAGWGIGYGLEYTPEKDEIIGVIPVGHGDGLRRKRGNEVLIDGQRIKIAGSECMDQTMLRLPRKYPIGTEVVLIGTQGNETIYIEDVSQLWGTAKSDVTVSISRRAPRIYTRDESGKK